MKYLALTITLFLFTSSYFVLTTMYEGGQSKGAERIALNTPKNYSKLGESKRSACSVEMPLRLA